MPAKAPYFDTSYLVRLYVEDRGFAEARQLAGSFGLVASAWHGQAEVVAALHRVYRERGQSQGNYLAALKQFAYDRDHAAFTWLPLTDSVMSRLENTLRDAPASTFLRAADALHLACAATHGFTEVYSHDRHFLAAAPLFGLRGLDVIPAG